MRPLLLAFRHTATGVQSLTVPRGGILQTIFATLQIEASSGWGNVTLRTKNENFTLVGEVTKLETDILSSMAYHGTAQARENVVMTGLNYRIDDRQVLRSTLQLLSGAVSQVWHVCLLWFDEFPPDDEPQRDERLAEGRRRLPPRAVSLEAARALIAESEGRLQVPKKPAH